MSVMVEMPRKEVPPPMELVKGRIEELLPPDAREEIEGGKALLVDVRDEDRFDESHIDGAVNVSAGQDAADAHSEEYGKLVEEVAGSRDRRLILYCGEGNRSARASDALRNEHGFENVTSIIGGLKLWNDLGYPVEGEVAVSDDDDGGASGGEG